MRYLFFKHRIPMPLQRMYEDIVLSEKLRE